MKTLTKVKLINWHTFSNEEFEIYKNALITGENGTGKSTILDAIQYVLTAGKCKFNKAASDIGNRTLESYIRCKTGIEGHEFVRNGDVTTYIALEFYDEKTEKYQIIGTVIDLPAGGRLNRDFFQIIDCKISDVAFIEERRVLTRKEFKKALIDHQQTGIFKDTIKEGESLFGNALGVKSKYFDLVTRALAFKAIDNVYQFIVDFLLKEDFVDIQNLRDSIKHYKVLEEKLSKINKNINNIKENILIEPESINDEDLVESIIKYKELISDIEESKLPNKIKLFDEYKKLTIKLEELGIKTKNLEEETKTREKELSERDSRYKEAKEKMLNLDEINNRCDDIIKNNITENNAFIKNDFPTISSLSFFCNIPYKTSLNASNALYKVSNKNIVDLYKLYPLITENNITSININIVLIDLFTINSLSVISLFNSVT